VSPLLTVHSSSASSSALASIRSICFIFSILRRVLRPSSSPPLTRAGRAVGRYFFTTHARIIVAPSRERVGIINY